MHVNLAFSGVLHDMNPVRAVLYLRISDDRFDDGSAVERQRAEAYELAERKGWDISEIYEDNDRGAYDKKGKRPEYDRMHQDFLRGRFDALMCADLDRLTRQPRQLEDWIDAAEDQGLNLVTLNGEADLSTDNGRLFARIKASVARAEVERKSARQKSKNRQLVGEGKPVPGRRRYGYLQGNTVPHPEEAPVVRRVFESLASGTTVYGLAKALNEEHVPLPMHKNSRGVWTPRRIRDLAANESYAGMVRHTTGGVTTVTESKYVKPLVAPELAEKVRTMLEDPARRTSPDNRVKHLLSGIAVCFVCGSSMFFTRSYRCKNDPSHPCIQKLVLEPFVRHQVLAALLCGPAAILPTDDEGMTLSALDEALKALQERVDGILELVREGYSTASAERPGLQVIKKEKEALQRRRDDIARTSVAAEVLLGSRSDLFEGHRASLVKAVEHRQSLAERFDGLTLERQRELIRFLLDITVSLGRGTERVHVEHKIVTSLNHGHDY